MVSSILLPYSSPMIVCYDFQKFECSFVDALIRVLQHFDRFFFLPFRKRLTSVALAILSASAPWLRFVSLLDMLLILWNESNKTGRQNALINDGVVLCIIELSALLREMDGEFSSIVDSVLRNCNTLKREEDSLPAPGPLIYCFDGETVICLHLTAAQFALNFAMDIKVLRSQGLSKANCEKPLCRSNGPAAG